MKREPPANAVRPEVFEPRLVEDPDDRKHRIDAIVWYGLYDRQKPELLELHTREMARRHPDCRYIFRMNVARFLRDSAYRAEIELLLTRAYDAGNRAPELVATLAMIVGQLAVPPHFPQEADRKAWLKYFDLPEDFALPTAPDYDRARRAVALYREAIAGAESTAKYVWTKSLVDLLEELGEHREAADAAEAVLALERRRAMPDLQLDLGRSLEYLGEFEGAARAYEAAIAEDTGGCEGGGHNTARAHLALGHLALSGGNREGAKGHLRAAVAAPCRCHTASRSFSMSLARGLAAAGEREAAREFCDAVLAKFGGDHSPVLALKAELVARDPS